MKRRSATILVTLVAMVGMIIAAPASATAQELDGITGTIQGTLDATGESVEGVIQITEFAVDDDGNLLVDGVFDGTVDGEPVTDTFQDVTATLTEDGQGRCDILFLDLEGLELDLLGLVVDLDPVVLDVFAEPGPGNLLGNLLCAVTGLLDGPGQGGGLLNAVDNLLDRVNDILDGLLG